MIDKLPGWYQVAKLKNLSADTLEHRKTDIGKIIKSKKLEWMLNCVRLFLNKPIIQTDFKDELIAGFRESDTLFPEKNNLLELRVLAGAILFEYVINGKSKDKM